MKLSFKSTKMLLVNVNARAELHGEEREPAGDVKLSLDCSNDALSELHPSLKSALYQFDDARPADLVDEGRRGDKGYLPHLRLPQFVPPFKWADEMTGVAVTIRQGKLEVALTECKINNIQFEPKDGGTIHLAFRVQCHPSERDFVRMDAGRGRGGRSARGTGMTIATDRRSVARCDSLSGASWVGGTGHKSHE